MKSGLNHPARIGSDRPSSGPAENLGSPAPLYVFCLVTSSRCRFGFVSQCYAFRFKVYFGLAWVIKNPASIAVSRVEKSLDPMIALPAYQKPIGVIPGLMFTQTT